MTKVWIEEMTSIAAMMLVAIFLRLIVADMKMAARAITPQNTPHWEYPGKRVPTIPPAVSRSYDLKMMGVRTKVHKDAPPIQQATAGR
ncbi:MAG: hypothetical protein A2X81_17905 [Desulfobacterales bacterium GWB2_56_26]|nr:MAG: hypothetical protein A2X81_17905 [Desulfobacterales bacterium GWB2_56_26]